MGPKTIELSGARTRGAHPYLTTLAMPERYWAPTLLSTRA
jgi:hypothetical protein